jgi:hypothetical protein
MNFAARYQLPRKTADYLADTGPTPEQNPNPSEAAMNLLSKLFRRPSPTTLSTSMPTRKARTRLGVEQLDQRELPSATAAFDYNTGALTITGDGGNDTVSVTEQNIYTGMTAIVISGVASSTSNGTPNGGVIYSPFLKSLSVNLGDGNDCFTLTRQAQVLNVTAPTPYWMANPFYTTMNTGTITCGNGNDTVNLSGACTAPFHVTGGNGNDTIYAGPGNNTILAGSGTNWLYGSGGNDYIRGGTGTNYIFGGGGNDTLIATGSGHNELYGGAGSDTLYGNGSGKCFLDPGSASEPAYTYGKDFSAYYPVINGTAYTDVVQGQGGTCWILASLAAAANRGVNLADSIQYQGNADYRVWWDQPDANHKLYEDVTFNGNLYSGADPQPQNGEFWTVIYQRALLEAFNDSITSPPGGSPSNVMPLLTGRASSLYYGNDMTDLTNALNAGKLVTAATNAPQAGSQYVTPHVVGNHAYMIEDVRATAWSTLYTSSGPVTIATDWAVDMYNPWGFNVSVSWNEFTSAVHDIDVS